MESRVIGFACAVCVIVLTACGDARTADVERLLHRFLVVQSTSARYADVDFIDQAEGWVTTPLELMHTQDGGRTWIRSRPGGSQADFVSGTTGWMLRGIATPANSSAVGITTNGGRSWKWHTLEGVTLYDVAGVSGVEAWAVGAEVDAKSDAGAGRAYSPRLVHTRSAASDWTKVSLESPAGSELQVLGLAFRDREHGWVVGVEAKRGAASGREGQPLVVFRTEDAGQHFGRVVTPPVPVRGDVPWRVRFVTETEGWIAPGGPSLLHTLDGGRQWEVVMPVAGDAQVRVRDCRFLPSGAGLAVGSTRSGCEDSALALRTMDGGKSWSPVEISWGTGDAMPNSRAYGAALPAERSAWIIGDCGAPPEAFGFLAKYLH